MLLNNGCIFFHFFANAATILNRQFLIFLCFLLVFIIFYCFFFNYIFFCAKKWRPSSEAVSLLHLLKELQLFVEYWTLWAIEKSNQATQKQQQWEIATKNWMQRNKCYWELATEKKTKMKRRFVHIQTKKVKCFRSMEGRGKTAAAAAAVNHHSCAYFCLFCYGRCKYLYKYWDIIVVSVAK